MVYLPRAIGWIILALVAGLASILYLQTTRSIRLERETASRQFLEATNNFTRKAEMQNAHIASALAAFQKEQVEIRRLLSELVANRAVFPDAATEEVLDEEVALVEEEEAASIETLEKELVAVPEGVRPLSFLRDRKGLESLLEDPRFNPTGRKFLRAESFALNAELVRARAQIEILDAEISAATTAGMETLRERGAYLEYAEGEKYDTVPGVLTAGEEMPHGATRMFYLYPDEFGEIYEKRKRRKDISSRATRRIATMMQELGNTDQ